MTIFTQKSLEKLQDPQLLVRVAKAVHDRASELIALREIPRHYLEKEIYEPATQRVTTDGRKYYEISSYSDGFGAALFVLDSRMLLLSSDHEAANSAAVDGDRDVYLTPLLKGLPREWDFVVDMLQTDPRFECNPPVGVFWFDGADWHITDLYDEITDSNSQYSSYRTGISRIDETDLNYLFDHAEETEVNHELIEAYLEDWKF